MVRRNKGAEAITQADTRPARVLGGIALAGCIASCHGKRYGLQKK